MDPRQHELARIALHVVGNRGFVLGGGHAVALHGMGSRPSEDVDLFSDIRGTPGEVADDVISAFDQAGLSVDVVRRTPDLVQMTVTYPDGHAAKVDLGVFWRARSPVILEVGPVLHPDDAVAGKMDALFNRWAPRDYLDIDAILVSERYTREQLLTIATEHNPGFDPTMFAESLSYLQRIPDRDFTPYEVTTATITAMRHRFADWEQQLTR
ncbi:nucleotidyl transferase AbiEii/AbiGii toxin family protein [Nocardia uniformis]|uniref:Nucleotidyl transferase AbiEii/AbiGii toxin family protein n=1 Tax=Nocardia uniformis TaxID=53432 RepID=A0A849CGS1_9NOCA|nr:nucleotidyl transferase AbiEii/AbiGii toxin family protein [Nocardia uniformis]NNH75907.1 nucleotidyl transferase AbiEii/AbiGii toxin family protein [Nocardia uniformis]